MTPVYGHELARIVEAERALAKAIREYLACSTSADAEATPAARALVRGARRRVGRFSEREAPVTPEEFDHDLAAIGDILWKHAANMVAARRRDELDGVRGVRRRRAAAEGAIARFSAEVHEDACERWQRVKAEIGRLRVVKGGKP